MSPALQAALLKFWETWWNQVILLDSANDRYKFIHWSCVKALDEAAEDVKELLNG